MNLESLVSRICSNSLLLTFGNKEYTYKSPNANIKYRASLIYNKTLEDYKYEEWLTEEEVKHILVINGFISLDIDKNIKEIDTNLENLKIDLYKACYNEKKKKDIRRTIGIVRSKQNDMYSKKHILDQYTLEGYAGLLKTQYILLNSIFYKGKVISRYNPPIVLLDRILFLLNENSIDYATIRKIARKEPWNGIWRNSKAKPFPGPVYEWSDEQRNLCLISKMYDSVYKNPECPPDDIIDDDDMMDGWLAIQRREAEKDRNTKHTEKVLGVKESTKGKGNEHFVMVDTQEEASKIYELNDANAKAIQNQRARLIEQGQEVKDSQFLDKKLEIQGISREMFKKTAGG